MNDPYEDELPQARFQLSFLRDLWPFVRPYKRGFITCLAILFLSFGLEMLGPWLMRLAIDGPMRNASAIRHRMRQHQNESENTDPATHSDGHHDHVTSILQLDSPQTDSEEIRIQLQHAE